MRRAARRLRRLGIALLCLRDPRPATMKSIRRSSPVSSRSWTSTPERRFADVGAGDGRYSVALARTVGERGRVYATEVDPDDLKKMEDRVEREKLSNVDVVRGTQEATGLSEACCDGILLRRVYHHFQNPAAMRRA